MDHDDYVVDPSRLRALRRERGLSQADLERVSGVRQQHVSTLERRPTRARLGTVIRLARALGVGPERLASGDGAAVGPYLLDATAAVRDAAPPDRVARQRIRRRVSALLAGLDQLAADLDALRGRLRRDLLEIEARYGDGELREDVGA